jgi:hypothetical protein
MRLNAPKISGFLLASLFVLTLLLSGCPRNAKEEAWESFQILMDALTDGRDNWASGSYDFSNDALSVRDVEIKKFILKDPWNPGGANLVEAKGKVSLITIKEIASPGLMREITGRASWSEAPLSKLGSEFLLENQSLSIERGPQKGPWAFTAKTLSLSDLALKAAGTPDLKAGETTFPSPNLKGAFSFIRALSASSVKWEEILLKSPESPASPKNQENPENPENPRSPDEGDFASLSWSLGSLFLKAPGFGESAIEGDPLYAFLESFSAEDVTLTKLSLSQTKNGSASLMELGELGAAGLMSLGNIKSIWAHNLSLNSENANPNPIMPKFSFSLQNATLTGLNFRELLGEGLLESLMTKLFTGRNPPPKSLREWLKLKNLLSFPFSLDSAFAEGLSFSAEKLLKAELIRLGFEGPFKRGEIASLRLVLDKLDLLADPEGFLDGFFKNRLGESRLVLDLDYSSSYDKAEKSLALALNKLNLKNSGEIKATLGLDGVSVSSLRPFDNFDHKEPLNLSALLSTVSLGLNYLTLDYLDASLTDALFNSMAQSRGLTPEQLKMNFLFGFGMVIGNNLGDVLTEAKVEAILTAAEDYLNDPKSFSVTLRPRKTFNLINAFPYLKNKAGLVSFLNISLSVNGGEGVRVAPDEEPRGFFPFLF